MRLLERLGGIVEAEESDGSAVGRNFGRVVRPVAAGRRGQRSGGEVERVDLAAAAGELPVGLAKRAEDDGSDVRRPFGSAVMISAESQLAGRTAVGIDHEDLVEPGLEI